MATEAQIKANRENAKKAGRKKGLATISAEQMRAMLAEQLAIHFLPIVEIAIKQAKKGDRSAREWLTDRAFGKAHQSIGVTGKLDIGKLLDEAEDK